ncbi:hypothetical protein GCM10022631_25950 [Deinococcus rubellus]|uniref:Uncharacterized protein n=1 Tax=Deinococcus rubellus TaxID=1889240 RepID=A0ABY5YFX1_9DEIO|nr:DUF6636 domain-containing protein [Deinococcus rubellus]UWX63948.1 hypothetical protein N0D28_14695 [Deinococcus rubellus]
MKSLLLLGLLGFGVASAQALTLDEGFSLPSKRLQCQFAPDGPAFTLRCDVLGPTFKAPRQPADCPLAWGDSLGLDDNGKPYFTCHGDTVMDPVRPVLAYGQIWQRGGINCASSTAGVRCSNRDGHGFELARTRYRLF